MVFFVHTTFASIPTTGCRSSERSPYSHKPESFVLLDSFSIPQRVMVCVDIEVWCLDRQSSRCIHIQYQVSPTILVYVYMCTVGPICHRHSHLPRGHATIVRRALETRDKLAKGGDIFKLESVALISLHIQP